MTVFLVETDTVKLIAPTIQRLLRRLTLNRLVKSTVTILLVVISLSSVWFSQEVRQLTQDKSKSSDRRIALVIGNGSYTRVSRLANPVNDATDIAVALESLGFEVIKGTDTNLEQMKRHIREFGEKLARNKGVGLFYYAGHGVEVRGKNFLIPVDADIGREVETEFYSVDVNLILTQMDDANNGFNIVILDACRNNPFSRGWTRSADTGGLANVNAPTGTFIAFAAAPGRTASDGTGTRNGIFTGALLKNLKRPNLKLEEVFKATREDVIALTKRNQVPWDSSSIQGDFYFSKSGEPRTNVNSMSTAQKPTPLPTPAPVTAEPKFDAESFYWNEVSLRNTRSGYELYLAEYPSGIHVVEAKKQIDKFKQDELARQKHIEREAEQTKWRDAQSLNSKESYDAYLRSYPNGKFVTDARIVIRVIEERLDQSKWDEVQILNRKSAFQSYLSEYPNGKYAADAKKKIKEISDADATSLREQQRAAERTKWEEAERVKTIAGYDAYLAAYPTGDYASIARLRLDSLGKKVVSSNTANTNSSTSRTAPGTVRKNSIGMELVYVPPGEFMMGSENANDSEKPVHRVTIRNGFWIGNYEVTQGQWNSIIGDSPSNFNNCGTNCPVERVSWDDIQNFLKLLNAKNDGFEYKLPSEAQWEYAARGGSEGDYYGRLEDIAWYANNSGRGYLDAAALWKKDQDPNNFSDLLKKNGGQTHRVGTKSSNKFGLFDMIGNVWEWCDDIYNQSGYAGLPTDGSANASVGDANLRVLRGGSWAADSNDIRVSQRYRNPPSTRFNTIGFRVVARSVGTKLPEKTGCDADPTAICMDVLQKDGSIVRMRVN